MFHLLQNDVWLGGIPANIRVTAVFACMTDFATERRAPESRVALKIVGLTVDDNGTQSAAVHVILPGR